MRAEDKAPATSTQTVRLPFWAYPAITIVGLFIGIEAIVRGTRALGSICDTDLANFFLKSASYILSGDPWHMYAVRDSCTITYPNYNPPLGMFLMAPFLALERGAGLASNIGAQVTFLSLPFILVVPVLGWIVVKVLRYLYSEISETQLFLAYALVVLSPLTWQTYGTWYHVEQPIMLCFLFGAVFALRTRREWLAGVFAGLAVLTRTTALMPLVAVGVLLLADLQWRPLLRFGGLAAVVAGAGFAPFFLFAPRDTLYSLVQWRGTAIIGSDSIWTLFAYDGTNTHSIRYLLDAVARRVDGYAVLLVIVVVALAAARRLHISAYSRDAWAVVAIAMLAVPLLSKTVWPYYYLEPFLALLIWEFASMHDRPSGVWRWPVLTLGFLAVTATLSQYIYLRSVGTLDRLSLGVLQFLLMLAFVILAWVRLPAIKPSGARAQPTNEVALVRPNVERALGAAHNPSPQEAAPFGPPQVPYGAQQPPAAANGGAWGPGNGAAGAPPLPGQAAPRAPLWPPETLQQAPGAPQPQTGGRPDMPGPRGSRAGGANSLEGWPNLWPEPPQSPRR
ncbi:MAG TPA: glycosyltransferase 87 family protein [Ktedonobacterales bacterium]|nr:glycosyltransferase 87 family protein [Ktedonobacterales bacterium]